MRKLIFILSLTLCSLLANAQQLEPNYHYSFWSNWNIGVGAVYSKPFDVQNWWIDNGANFGVDVRLEKPLSNWWTIRLDACIPGLISTNCYDRYGTLMGGVNLNFGKYFYLFADGGLSVSKFGVLSDKNFNFAGDGGLGTHIWFSDNAKLYLEVGADCVSKFELDNSNLFAKLGFMYCLGVTKSDREKIAEIHECRQNVPLSEYERIVKEKELCSTVLETTINELDNMRNCCQKNYQKYEEQINSLKVELEKAKANVSLPFSVLFSKNSVELSKDAKEIISQVAIEINKNGGNYTLYGFGDYTGSDDYNEVLSASRCEAVKSELIRNGVDENKVKVVGLGKTQYFGTPESYVNRRVMFVKD